MALTFLSPPRASLDTLRSAMTRAYSPAALYAASLYAVPVKYGIDPAVAWAFAEHEHQFFTNPKAVTVIAGRNWGALRTSQGGAYKQEGGFAWYRTYEAGLDDWCKLITRYYVGRGLDTVEECIPVYAPSTDRNKPVAYIAYVLRRVAEWQAASGLIDPWQDWGDAYPLPPEQRAFAIPQAWLSAGLGAAISAELYEAWGAYRFFERGVIAWFRDGNETKIYRWVQS